MGIVLGLCSGQLAGLIMTGKKGEIPGSWRWVVAVSGVVATVQIVGGSFMEASAGGMGSPREDEGKSETFDTDVRITYGRNTSAHCESKQA